MSHEIKFSNFHCSVERHMARAGLSRAAVLIYSWALRISKKSRKFTVSPASASAEFSIPLRSAQRAFEKLKKFGLFVLIESGKAAFESSTYKVLTHKEWALDHPGLCAEKYNLPSSKDALGVALFSASGCRVKFQAFQIGIYHNTGLTDDEIMSIFIDWYPDHKEKQIGKTWRRSVGYSFGQYLNQVTRPIGEKFNLPAPNEPAILHGAPN